MHTSLQRAEQNRTALPTERLPAVIATWSTGETPRLQPAEKRAAPQAGVSDRRIRSSDIAIQDSLNTSLPEWLLTQQKRDRLRNQVKQLKIRNESTQQQNSKLRS